MTVGTGPPSARPGLASPSSHSPASSAGEAQDPLESPILRGIRLEGEAQADAIVAEAAQRGEELVALAESAADERVRRALVDAGPSIAREANRIVNDARVRAIHRRTRMADDRLDGVFAAAARRLSELGSNPEAPRWREALARLAADASRFTGEGSSLAIGERGGFTTNSLASPVAGGPPGPAAEGPQAGGVPDVGVASPDPSGGVPDPADGDCECEGCDEEVRAGVLSRSSDGRLEADATIATRLAQARLRMADVVARILLGERAP